MEIMTWLLVIFFILGIIGSFVTSFIETGFNLGAFENIIIKIVNLRGYFFILFFIYVTLSIMVRAKEYWYCFLPFLLCGLSIELIMYKKTREIGTVLFLISVFVEFLIIMLISLLKMNTPDHDGFIILPFWILFSAIVVHEYKSNKKNKDKK